MGPDSLLWRAILHVVYDNEHKDKVQLLNDTRNTYEKKELRRVNESVTRLVRDDLTSSLIS